MRQHETSSSLTSAEEHAAHGSLQPLHELAPDTLKSLVVYLKKQWQCYRKHLRKCQRKFSERSVHDLRVSARRLLSLLDLLAHFLSADHLKKTQTALKTHLDTFDDLRDVQVQLLAVRKLKEEFPAARCFHRFLKKRAERLTRSTYRKARNLRSKPVVKLIDAARADVKACIRAAGARQPGPLLLSAVNYAFTVTRKLRDRINPADTHSIHCTRVAFKKFRYVVEALADHLPQANETLLASMRHYQTLMGDVQDAEVLLRAFQKFLRKEKAEIQQAVRFEHELERRRQRSINKYLGAADQLLDFWPMAATAVPVKHSSEGNGQRVDAIRRASPPPRSMTKDKTL